MLANPASEIRPVAQDAARPVSVSRAERLGLGAIVVLYLIATVGFAVATPYGEAPDEHSHLLYTQHLLQFGTLPEIRPLPYSGEAIQPPLYYAVGAALVLAARRVVGDPQPTADLAPFLSANPKAQTGESQAQMLHPPEQRWPPGAYLLRGYSILLGLGAALLTYRAVRVLVPPPAPATAALGAAAFAALLPQANFIRASISNENLAALLGAWIIWLLARHLTQPHNKWRVVALGVALGLGLLTKLSVAPLLLPVLWILWLRRIDLVHLFRRDFLTVSLLMLALAGPFYVYRWVAYGDPFATAAWIAMIPTDSPWTLADFFWLTDPFRWMLWTSFWGVYGWQIIWMPAWIYYAFAVLTLLAILGGLRLIWRRALTPAQWLGSGFMLLMLILLYLVVIVISLRLIAWQGREMFPALPAIAGLFGIGLAGLVLGRGAVRAAVPLARWRQWLGAALVPALALGLFAVNLYSVVALVWPALNTP
jgi:4-amino-4-deoxy-L-arabinose transferase-like glycosyltransferase